MNENNVRVDKIFNITYSVDRGYDWCEIYCEVIASSKEEALGLIKSECHSLDEDNVKYTFGKIEECINSLDISASKACFLRKQNTECICSLGE